jgi:enoyl-CoA hydratase/carnithine racemase
MNAILDKFGPAPAPQFDLGEIGAVLETEKAEAVVGGSSPAETPLTKIWVKPLGALIVTKAHAGFDRACIEDLQKLVDAIARGEVANLKFLVLDFAHDDEEVPRAADGFEDLVAANAELILDTPVITLAWARSMMAGADLDFALHCSMLVAQKGARFSFAGDPFALFGLYAALGRKIGFVKAERLIENHEVLDAEEMRDFLIAKDVVEPQEDIAAIEGYLQQFDRRYNASHAIFRAQRMAMPPIDRRSAATRLRR